jgi:hypothetical protein
MKLHSNQQPTKTVQKLNIAMYLTMTICLIIISAFTYFENTNCTTVQIKSKNQVTNKYFYQLSNGSQVWSDQNFSVNESVCISVPAVSLAQK